MAIFWLEFITFVNGYFYTYSNMLNLEYDFITRWSGFLLCK